MEKLYTAKATATGGRNGQVKSTNGALDIETRAPKEMGGPAGNFLNPEILFAGGYAACFDSALNVVIRKEKVQGGTTAVTAEVSIGKEADGSFKLAVILDIEIPGVEKAVAQDLANKAHQLCPYSNAIRGNVEVELKIVE